MWNRKYALPNDLKMHPVRCAPGKHHKLNTFSVVLQRFLMHFHAVVGLDAHAPNDLQIDAVSETLPCNANIDAVYEYQLQAIPPAIHLSTKSDWHFPEAFYDPIQNDPTMCHSNSYKKHIHFASSDWQLQSNDFDGIPFDVSRLVATYQLDRNRNRPCWHRLQQMQMVECDRINRYGRTTNVHTHRQCHGFLHLENFHWFGNKCSWKSNRQWMTWF